MGEEVNLPDLSMTKTPISKDGYEALRAEHDHLIDVERPRVCDEVAFAAAQGDRSENAEYIYGKKRLREIDRRIGFLRRRLDGVAVVERLPEDLGVVRFGATVELSSAAGKAMTATLVGKDEIDPMNGRFSLDSPVGKALLGRRIGEVATVATPRGEVAWTVLSIRY
jgi:transcription elongation factor GreB